MELNVGLDVSFDSVEVGKRPGTLISYYVPNVVTSVELS
jgi:hypothetical protein